MYLSLSDRVSTAFLFFLQLPCGNQSLLCVCCLLLVGVLGWEQTSASLQWWIAFALYERRIRETRGFLAWPPVAANCHFAHLHHHQWGLFRLCRFKFLAPPLGAFSGFLLWPSSLRGDLWQMCVVFLGLLLSPSSCC